MLSKTRNVLFQKRLSDVLTNDLNGTKQQNMFVLVGSMNSLVNSSKQYMLKQRAMDLKSSDGFAQAYLKWARSCDWIDLPWWSNCDVQSDYRQWLQSLRHLQQSDAGEATKVSA